jgi:CRISPR/Cas system-associated exonuclease Cas4 (RecB family)
MQKYNEILQQIEHVYEKTQSISYALKDGDFEIEHLEKISALYEEREITILKLKDLLESEIGKEFVVEYKTFWDEKINLIINLDSYNLELLKERTKSTGEKLKQLQKQKKCSDLFKISR